MGGSSCGVSTAEAAVRARPRGPGVGSKLRIKYSMDVGKFLPFHFDLVVAKPRERAVSCYYNRAFCHMAACCAPYL